MMVPQNQRRLRVAAGLSQAELAAAAGVTKSTIAAIEQGKANPRLDTLAAIAAALRVELADLVAAEPAPAVAVTRGVSGPTRLAAGLLHLDLPARHEEELRPAPGAQRAVFVLSGRLISGPVEAPTELDAGDCAVFAADGPTLLRTGRQRARILVHERSRAG